ncbi:MAG: hypothetical protein FJX52_05535, partial [Alphaproteobacteria bacterium]|nr:hypothetical protein [Alphaproteobacteria bacterium]
PIFEPPELRPLPAALRGYVTFGSFNQLAKLSNLCLTTWARILVAVPGSRLIIKGQGLRNSEVRNRYLDTFGRHGVAADRLDLRPPTSGFIEHLDAFGECDVMLDSFPYNGVTTTCESLMMGLPVVTLLGDRIAGRYGASLLTAVGRADEIAMDVDDYVARAMRLAGDMNRLIELRQTLRGMLAASALYRPRHFAEHLEAAYRNLWRNWCDGDRP